MIRCSSVSPATYSITMKNTSSSFSAVSMVTMFGMAHRGEEARLLQHVAEVEILLVRNLDGDVLLDPGVFGKIHAAEAAAAQMRQHAVLPDGLTPKEHVVGGAEYSMIIRVRARFYAPQAHKSGDVVPLPDDEAEHLTRVLRLKRGDEVFVFNGAGARF